MPIRAPNPINRVDDRCFRDRHHRWSPPAHRLLNAQGDDTRKGTYKLCPGPAIVSNRRVFNLSGMVVSSVYDLA